jgi:hypothetical protein
VTGPQHHEPAARAAHQRQVLRVHAAVYAGSIVLIVLVNLALNAAAGLLGEWWAWWSALAVLGWGLGLSVHAIVVRVTRPRDPGSRGTSASSLVDPTVAS